MMPPLRTALYLPANRASAVAKARAAPCDAVILDLEDAVAPEAKDEARAAAMAAATEGGFGERLLVVRANGSGSAWCADDLSALAHAPVAAALLPKVSAPADLAAARSVLPAHIALWAMVETCAAMLDLAAICREARALGLAALVMGTNDLALEMRCTLDAERSAVLPVLTQAVVCARAHGLAVLDGVFNRLDDEAGLAHEARQAAALGFDGKTAIHPAQLGPINAAFTPDAAAIARAQGIVAAFAAPENAGKGAIRHEGAMVELLHLREAERVLALAVHQ